MNDPMIKGRADLRVGDKELWYRKQAQQEKRVVRGSASNVHINIRERY